MFLPPFRRLLVEDFKGQEGWIGKLLFPINQFFQSISVGLQNGLTFQENIASQIYTATFNNNTAEFPIVFKNTLKTTPIGCLILSVQDVSTTPQNLTGAVGITSREFDPANNQHRIKSLSGLVSGQQYKITFLLI